MKGKKKKMEMGPIQRRVEEGLLDHKYSLRGEYDITPTCDHE
jgi:hypothetical protein